MGIFNYYEVYYDDDGITRSWTEGVVGHEWGNIELNFLRSVQRRDVGQFFMNSKAKTKEQIGGLACQPWSFGK